MTIDDLIHWFMWLSMINGGVIIYWFLFQLFASDFLYLIHSRWFDISRDTYAKTMYGLFFLYIILYVTFILVPYLALLII